MVYSCSFDKNYKILNESIDPDEVLKGTLVPIIIPERPSKMPIAIEWPTDIILENERFISFSVDGSTFIPLYHTDINLLEPSETGDLRFEIHSGLFAVELILSLFKNKDT